MHMLNLGNANMHLIHMPNNCRCRNKSVNWLRPKQLQGSQNGNCWPVHVHNHTSCVHNWINTFYQIRIWTTEGEIWLPGAVFYLKSKSYLGFTEPFAKVQHGTGENPSGVQESCMKLGANSASIRSQTLAGSKTWKSSSAGNPRIAGCEETDSWCHQLPSDGRRCLQWGWSMQIKSWLQSTRGAFPREQKTLNEEIKHRLDAQINTCP